MKKLTAGIFTVLIGLCAANSADAAVASKDYADAVANAAQAAAEATAKNALDTYKTEQAGVDSAQDTNISNLTDLVGTLPEGTTAKDVVDYVNVKTSGIATNAALSELQETVSTNTEAITTINGDASTPGSFAKAIADSINALSAEGGAIKNVADALATHETTAASTYATKTEVDTELAKKQDKLTAGDHVTIVAGADGVTTIDAKISNVDVAVAEQSKTAPSFTKTQSMINDSIADSTQAITALQGLVGETAVSEQISTAVNALTEGAIKTNADDIDALEGRMTTAEGDIDALETALNDETDGLIKKVAANAAKAAKNAEDVASNAQAILNNTTSIGNNSDAIAANTASIKAINEGAVMTSGITKEKVDAFDASKVVTDGINAGDITEAGKYVLTATVGEGGVVSDYKWEIIERSQPTGDEA